VAGDRRGDGCEDVNRDIQNNSVSRQKVETPAEVQIRLARPEEASTVSNVLYESFVEYRAFYTEKAFAATTPDARQVLARMREGPIWLAFWDADLAVLGTVAAVLHGESLYVRGMAVVPAARRLRVGLRLLEQVEHWASAKGCRRMFLTTTPFLDAAIRLYERFGFRRTNDGDLFGTPLFTMEKNILQQE
jgi:GNAT superfamily N-acetyltransferase